MDRLTVLAIDDQMDNLVTLKAVLSVALPGTVLLTATKGLRGIELAQSENPDVILLDIVMPNMDGFEVCRRLKNHPATQFIPVVFLTALHSGRELRNRALLAGSAGFLNKPLDEIELAVQIQTMAKIKQGAISQKRQGEWLRKLVDERTRDLLLEIEERKMLGISLRESEIRFRTIFEQSPFGIALVDSLTGRVQAVNQRFADITGRTLAELHTLDWMSITHPDDLQEDMDNMTRMNAGKISGFKMCKRYVRPDGTFVWIDMTIAPIRDKDQGHPHHLCMVEDITSRKAMEENLLHLNLHDFLTGLFNRRFFEEELRRLDTGGNLPMTLVMGDVNGLKLINDSFGHLVGDELLKDVAAKMKRTCRAGDIIARLGGDEFAIILPKTDPAEADKLLDRIRQQLSEDESRSIKVSISFGSGTKRKEEENIQDILIQAEDQMYRNKIHDSSSMRSKTIGLVMKTLFEKSGREMLHSERVSEICGHIAAALHLEADSVSSLRVAGLMHDIGKIGVADQILNNSHALSEDEWLEMKKHPEAGFRILSLVNEFSKIAAYVLEHHERWDGKGYPNGLKGECILIHARVIAIADAYDAMTSPRAYGNAKSEEDAANEIRKCAGSQFDPDIARVFLEKVLGRVWDGNDLGSL